MKVTKRDGRVVDYDRNKIIVAIQKANAEVDRYEQVSEEKIDAIVAELKISMWIICRWKIFRT